MLSSRASKSDLAPFESDEKDRTRLQAIAVQKQLDEVLKQIDEIKLKRDGLNNDISKLKQDKNSIHMDIAKVTSDLFKLNESLCSNTMHIRELDALEVEYNRQLDKLLRGSEFLVRSMSRATADIEKYHEARSPRV